jgi:hypothetical protein
MFCPGCGSTVADGRTFCGKCGARLNAAASAAPQAAPVQPVPVIPSQPARPPSPYRWAVYAAVLLLAAVGGAAWWWFHRPPPPYQVQDPGIYPFFGLTADGKAMKWGFIDADGKVLIQPTWDNVDDGDSVLGRAVAFNEGLCGVMKDGKWGYIDTSGNLVISNQFDTTAPFVEGMARVHFGNQIGYIDKTGRLAINPQFYEAGDFHSGLAAVRTDDGWGFINKTGAFVIKPHFQAADANGFSGGFAGVCTGGKCGFIDHSGQFAIRAQFNTIGTFSEGMAEVGINGKLGYVNTSGTIVINPQFDQSTMFSGGLAAVTVSGRQGTIDKQGKYVLNPGQYNFGLKEGDALVAVTNQGIGLITKGGQWLIQPSTSLTSVGPIFGKVFLGTVGEQPSMVPISVSGKVLAGPYKGSMLASLAQDIQDETSAIQSMHTLTAAETAYSGTYPSGFTDSLEKLGPATGAPDQNHAGLIDITLATGTKDGYQFGITIPAGTSTGGSNFNYFLVAKPASGHAGRTFCADSSGTVRYAEQGQDCSTSSPVL